jgi:hypothetical protein
MALLKKLPGRHGNAEKYLVTMALLKKHLVTMAMLKKIPCMTLLLDTYKYNKDVCHYINILLFHNFVILIHFGHRFSLFHL